MKNGLLIKLCWSQKKLRQIIWFRIFILPQSTPVLRSVKNLPQIWLLTFVNGGLTASSGPGRWSNLVLVYWWSGLVPQDDWLTWYSGSHDSHLRNRVCRSGDVGALWHMLGKPQSNSRRPIWGNIDVVCVPKGNIGVKAALCHYL